ncbi:MAG: uL30 family ribosomal protein [Candidatus Nanohalobium sp.]
MTLLVAVKVRGSIDASESISRTLQTLGLEKKNQARIMEDNESNRGMLRKAKDYIAYGEVDQETVEQLEAETGETVTLSPPSGGFKSTKKQRHQGGSLGKRDDMEELLGKML